MADIDKTLDERGSRYGSFEDNSNVVQSLMEVLETKGKNYNQFTRAHKEAVHMIFHKIARMVSGDPNYVDNVHDIVGYAKLLEEYLIEQEKKLEKQAEIRKNLQNNLNYQYGKFAKVNTKNNPDFEEGVRGIIAPGVKYVL